MVTLAQLVAAIRASGQQVRTDVKDLEVRGVTSDSRKVQPGTVFVALQGERDDGHAHVAEALAKGCCCVVVEKEIERLGKDHAIRVADTHLAYGYMAAAFYGYPAREMTLIGLTGTNGKTTTSWIIEELLVTAGKLPGMVGTVNYHFSDRKGAVIVREAPLTTPEPDMLHGLLRQMSDAGVTHVVMEVSSHALAQQRLAGIKFDLGVFTNLSRDHLDYHRTMDEYFKAKQKLFLEYLAPAGTAVIVDDEPESGSKNAKGWGKKLIDTLLQNEFVRYRGNEMQRSIITCGLHKDCIVQADKIVQDIDGFDSLFMLGGEIVSVRPKMIGRHNVLNMLTAAGVGIGLGLRISDISSGLEKVEQVPGRLERVVLPPYTQQNRKPAVFVDYAHTPDALKNALQALQPVTRGQLFCVFGCGGDRDSGKRPMMGQVAGQYADRVVVTSDNPRSEDPDTIISEIEPGLRDLGCHRVDINGLFGDQNKGKKYTLIADRSRAIQEVCAMAGEKDVVLVAGKGHEAYQITTSGKRFFDDRQEAVNSSLRWTVEGLVKATAGIVEQQGTEYLLGEISTDTRTIRPGDIFLALKGDNFNGHDFIKTALDKGAAALVISEPCRLCNPGVSVVRVRDTLKALGDLAHFRRKLLVPELKVVGITGSSGKTTVKEMTAAIFKEQHEGQGSGQVLKTEGNLNNLIGLPLSLLRVHSGHGTAVLEMGMNRPGEIERLAGIADPDIGCITNVQAAHLEGLGSIEGVARAKKELFRTMRPQGIRILNFDDPHVSKGRGEYGDNVIGFAVTPRGRRRKPAVRATRVSTLGESGMRFTLHIDGWQRRITIPAPGEHNVANSAAAAAIATAAGVEPEIIIRGLVSYRSGDKRLQVEELPGGIKVMNDSYNANPSSMAAALHTISQFGPKSRKAVVLGDMLELGTGAASAHRKVGTLVAELGYDFLAVKGDFAPAIAGAAIKSGMKKSRIMVGESSGDVAAWLSGLINRRDIGKGDWILVKGSRGMRMEQVLTELEKLIDQAGN